MLVKIKALAATLLLGTSMVFVLPGCQEEATALLLEVRTRTQISTLFVQVKQYHDDGLVTLYGSFDTEISTDEDGYIVTNNGTPLRLNVELPGSGRYAIHIVAIPLGVREDDPLGDRLVATICHDVSDVTLDDGVYLGRLTPELDADRDTFPEDAQAFCEAKADSGMPCDTSCNVPAYMAMVDCNPDPFMVVPEGCGAIGEDRDWNPFAIDHCEDCLDHDCYNGDTRCEDRDGDGFTGRDDCDDNDPLVHRDAEEICGNGIDENCRIDVEGCDSGDRPCDNDGDSFYEQVSETCGRDCDDTNDTVNPHAFEGCGSDPDRPSTACPGCGSGDDTYGDGIDNNCNGRIDEACFSTDIDNDGLRNDIDCNDCNAGVGPGLPETCDNGIDEDCNGSDLSCEPNDGDGDGIPAEPGGSDCIDDDPHAYPGAADYCDDGIAQDCSLELACSSITDEDGDHFGAQHGDCDDLDASINPWSDEVCDNEGVDEDCDGQVNEIWDSASAESIGCGFNQATDQWYEIIYESDLYNCGTCSHNCCLNERFLCEGNDCVGGECRCYGEGPCAGTYEDTCCDPESGTDGVCIDITTNVEHCGECGHRCAEFGDEQCVSPGPGERGQCSCPHEGGVACPDEFGMGCCPVDGCTNVFIDPKNCGACGNDCTEGPFPRGDMCTLSTSNVATCYCQSPPTQCIEPAWCTGANDPSEGSCGCHDLTRELANCGRCGLACDENEVCQDSRCLCPGDSVDCEGTETNFCCPTVGCVDRTGDENNCGVCGLQCYDGEVCQDSNCICGPGPCDDGDPCTEDSCAGGRCIHRTLDEDDDGYCAPGCADEGRGDCNDLEPDCDDTNPSIHPGAQESCTTPQDDDCDDNTNDRNATGCTNYFLDTDHDTYGDSSTSSRCFCTTQDDYSVTNSDDCDDSNAEVHPDATETCATGYDDDCDDDTNDLDAVGCTSFNLDTDNDTYGTSAIECHCTGSGDYTASNADDCNDGNDTIHPSAPELCSTGADDDCDGDTNDLDASGCTTRYRDVDDDGYGQTNNNECRCTAEGSYDTTSSGDCDDDDPAVNPGANDVCNGVDDDCNSSTADGADECTFCCGSPAACRDCCDDVDCGPGDWSCSGYSCSCDGQVCDETCYGGGDCCIDTDCDGDNNVCDGNYQCVCNSGWLDCSGDGSCDIDGECCEDNECSELYPDRADNCSRDNWCECDRSNRVCDTDECCCGGRCGDCPC